MAVDWELRRQVRPTRGIPCCCFRAQQAGVPAWIVHAEKGDGGLTDQERRTLEACPHAHVVTIPGHVFFMPQRIAEIILEAIAETGYDQEGPSPKARPSPV